MANQKINNATLNGYLKGLNLSKRALNVFINNFESLADFLATDNKKFSRLPNAGKKTILELSTLQLHLSQQIHEKNPEILAFVQPEKITSLSEQSLPSLGEANFYMFIEKYYLSRRVKNILINNFRSIEDFCNASQEQLLKLNNSGISSVREMVRVQEKLKKTNIQDLEKEISKKLQETIKSEEPSSFKELLMRSMKLRSLEGNKPIILKRLAGELTLQEAANQWTPAVTRERIRQIERKILSKLSAHKDRIVDEINSCKANSTKVMYLWELGIQNSFFEGLNEYISTRKSTLLRKILSDDKCKFELDDIVSHL